MMITHKGVEEWYHVLKMQIRKKTSVFMKQRNCFELTMQIISLFLIYITKKRSKQQKQRKKFFIQKVLMLVDMFVMPLYRQPGRKFSAVAERDCST